MTPYLSDPDLTLYNGDALEVLRGLPAESVQMCVTSPPYWGLRDYGTGTWDGGDAECDHAQRVNHGHAGDVGERNADGNAFRNSARYVNQGDPATVECKCGARRVDNQLGLETTPELYIERMVEVFREVKRVLRADGTCWLNIGDSYAQNFNGGQGRRTSVPGQRWGADAAVDAEDKPARDVPAGLKPKDLCMIPARLALALQADGWYLRSQIVWSKPNPMPESVTDRPTSAYELVYLLAKQPRYYFDAEAVREPHARLWSENNGGSWAHTENQPEGSKAGHHSGPYPMPNPAGRNLRNVWTIATEPFSGWTKSVRRVREEPDAGVDGKRRITSPDCPLHGDRPAPVPTASDGERAGDESTRTERIAARLDREPLTVFAPTGQSLELEIERHSSDSPDLGDVPTAKPRSKGTRRKASRSASGGTASEETPGRTEGTSPSSESPELDDSGSPDSSETLDHTSRTCSCEWEYTENASHFATFPQALVERCIKAGSAPGDVVFDPFLGSGTTALVARRLGRRCIGIELSPDYCELAAKRTQQLSLEATA